MRVSVECSEKWATKIICGKHRGYKTIVQSFSYEAYPYCCQRIGNTTYNSARGSAKKVTIACLRNGNVTETFRQMTSQNEKSLQITCSKNFLRMKNLLMILLVAHFSLHPTLILFSINFLSHRGIEEPRG